MELEVITILISIIMLMIGVGTAFIVMKIGTKRNGKDSVVEGWKKISKEKDLALLAMQKEVDRQRGKANRAIQQLRDVEDEQNEIDEEKQNDVTWDQLKELAKTKGINPMLLEIPQVKEIAQSAIQGKSIGEVAQLVQGLEQLYKNRQSVASPEGESITYN